MPLPSYVGYSTTCRNCPREVSKTLPQSEAKGVTKGIRLRCSECGTTNFATPDGDALTGGAA